MSGQIFDSRAMTALERGLDAASLRQQVISNNLANVNTPGFKASHVRFESLLQDALDSGSAPAPLLQPVATNPMHFGLPVAAARPAAADPVAGVRPAVERETGTSARNDGNNVDMEREITSLMENSLVYNALVSQVSTRFAWLRTAIFEGRR
ncbi:MAG: flagellar basal body rod protein FlgB [Firmicutes bacterium]|nr:flagellar basal body rod protein FlgB [Bacillota bacterium]